MHWIDWLIVLIPITVILGAALYSKKYVRGVADFLAAGRVAGRYVIAVGDMQAAWSVVLLVAQCEILYKSGMAFSYWNNSLILPVVMFMSLTGYCIYRYRQTKCLSLGQFLEMRYNRPFRIIASSIRTFADMMANAIGPAVAARFFIYFIGLPLKVNLFGLEVSTFVVVMVVVLSMAMLVIWPGGRISLLITDSIQGLMSYPIFVIFTVFILSEISWSKDVAPVMLDRAPGESFLNPMDIESLRDFNMFALIVLIIGRVLNRAAWLGNDTSSSGRNAHEQKMAAVLGAWRNGFLLVMFSLLTFFIITIMLSSRFSNEAKDIRIALTDKVAAEIIENPSVRQDIMDDISVIPPATHVIGVDEPYSQKSNPDIPYLDTVQKYLSSTPADSATFQKFRTLYYQMMMPTLLRMKLPIGMMGLFLLMMVMLMLSTDDSRIFNSSSSLLQDVIMPFRKKPFEPKQHLVYLRAASVVVCLIFLLTSVFLSQMDYISMFINIMCALWLGAAGPIMIGGLYTRFGTTTGAFGALIFGSGMSFAGLILQRTWCSNVYPWLLASGNLKYVQALFGAITSAFSPYIVWEITPFKFPINSYEIYFMAMMSGVLAYLVGSWLTCRKPYNLDRLLHRGEYSDGESHESKSPWTWSNMHGKLIGITGEYTTGDKVIAWSVFGYSVVFQFFISFVCVLIWNIIDPWPVQWWSTFFFITIIIVGILAGGISTIWFLIGGIIDIRRLFKDLAARVDNPLDDGWVVGHVALADAETLGTEEEDEEAEKVIHKLN